MHIVLVVSVAMCVCWCSFSLSLVCLHNHTWNRQHKGHCRSHSFSFSKRRTGRDENIQKNVKVSTVAIYAFVFVCISVHFEANEATKKSSTRTLTQQHRLLFRPTTYNLRQKQFTEREKFVSNDNNEIPAVFLFCSSSSFSNLSIHLFAVASSYS